MEWALILALGVWVAFQQARMDRLERRLDAEGGRPLTRTPEPSPWRERPEPEPDPRPRCTDARPPPPRVEPIPEPRPIAARPAVEPVARAPAMDSKAISNWLSENGLAWLGGGALALGGLLLVVYAAQRGFFTPAMRIGAAVIVGALMLAASEWIRRQTQAPGGRHQLASSASAGAGGATIYGAIWAANHLYNLIPFGAEAALIVALSAGLLAYAWVQGEALAALAIAGAFAAPALTGVKDWGSPAIEIYLSALIATGFAFSGLRGWFRTGYLTLAATLMWAVPSLIEGPAMQPALLILAAPLAAFAAVEIGRRRLMDDAEPRGFAWQAPIAVWAASGLAIGLWFNVDRTWIAAGVAATLAALAAAVTVRKMGPAWTMAIPIACSTYAIAAALYGLMPPMKASVAPAYATLPALIALAGLIGGLRDRALRAWLLACGGVGAAVIATLVWPALEQVYANAWIPAALIAAMMAAGGWLVVRAADDPSADRGLTLWLGGAAELLFLAVFAAVDPVFSPVAEAVAALALAGLAVRLNWSGLGRCAVAGALAAVACMLRPGYLKHAVNDPQPWASLALAALAAAIVFGAARLIASAPSRPTGKAEAEGLDTAALIIALLGAFFAIQHFAGGPTHSIGPHLAASLRTVILLVATLLLAIRATDRDGAISRWRLRVQLIVTLIHGVGWQMLGMSPWWGAGEQPLGPPLLNTLLLSYLAPAGLLLAMYRKRLPGPPQWTRLLAVAALLFAVAWAVLTIRQGFHPGQMKIESIGRAEVCAYALVLLGVAVRLIHVRRKASGDVVMPGAWLAEFAEVIAWAALAVLAGVFWVAASPWWGFDQSPLMPIGAAALLFGLYAAGVGACLVLDRAVQALSDDGLSWRWLRQAAQGVAVAQLFVLLTLVVRYGFQGADMAAARAEASLQTWAFSAAWALYGLGVMILGGQRRNYTLRWLGLIGLLATLLKVVVFDLSRLDGVIRAASFLAVGALFLAGALAARRLNAGPLLFAPRAKTE